MVGSFASGLGMVKQLGAGAISLCMMASGKGKVPEKDSQQAGKAVKPVSSLDPVQRLQVFIAGHSMVFWAADYGGSAGPE
ncbi:UNVERIFIED_CONTAM: hypothetical protein K2H54_007297 [Gekko kuhli]